MQSKLGSTLETVVQFVSGLAISLLSYMFILPLFGFSIPLSTNVALTLYFAVVSIIRSYIVRRTFNAQVRHTVPRGTPNRSTKEVGGERSLPGMRASDYYADATDETPQGKGPVRYDQQQLRDTGLEEDKELRK